MATPVNCFLNTSNGETKTYEITINASQFDNSSVLTYLVTMSELTCGIRGTVPPLIVPLSNQKEYSYITKAQVEYGGLYFTFSKKPTQDIKLLVIDVK